MPGLKNQIEKHNGYLTLLNYDHQHALCINDFQHALGTFFAHWPVTKEEMTPHPLCSLQWYNKNEGDTIHQNKSISMLSQQHEIIKFPLSKLCVCTQVPYLTPQQDWLSAALVVVLQQQSWTSSSHCIRCMSNYTGYTLRATVEVQAKSVALVSQEVTSAQRMQTMTNVCASVHS